MLKKINILDPSESPTAQENDDVVDVMNSVYDELKELGHINWTLTGIPTRYQEPFIELVSWHVSPQFGVPRVDYPRGQRPGERSIFALNERKLDPRASRVVDY